MNSLGYWLTNLYQSLVHPGTYTYTKRPTKISPNSGLWSMFSKTIMSLCTKGMFCKVAPHSRRYMPLLDATIPLTHCALWTQRNTHAFLLYLLIQQFCLRQLATAIKCCTTNYPQCQWHKGQSFVLTHTFGSSWCSLHSAGLDFKLQTGSRSALHAFFLLFRPPG